MHHAAMRTNRLNVWWWIQNRGRANWMLKSKQNKSIDMKAKCSLYFSLQVFCSAFTIVSIATAVLIVCASFLYLILFHSLRLYFRCCMRIVRIVHIIKIHLYYISKINILCAYEVERRKYKKKRRFVMFIFFLLLFVRSWKEHERREWRKKNWI